MIMVFEGAIPDAIGKCVKITSLSNKISNFCIGSDMQARSHNAGQLAHYSCIPRLVQTKATSPYFPQFFLARCFHAARLWTPLFYKIQPTPSINLPSTAHNLHILPPNVCKQCGTFQMPHPP